MTDDLDSVLGIAAPPPRRPGRPSKADIAAREAAERDSAALQASIKAAAGGRAWEDVAVTLKPVTMNWLSLAFKMDPATVKKRLLTCPSLGNAGGGRPIYDFKTAVAYLVEPKMDIDAYIRSIDPAKLPNHINKVYWEAKRTELKYKLEAGEAWATHDVLEVFGSVFMTIKDQMQLWIDTLAENSDLNDDQRTRLTEMVDALQGEIHGRLIDMPKQRRTTSIAEHSYEETVDVEDMGDQDGSDLIG